MTDVERLGKILAESRRAVFFGGAGMSTESGIPDFRSAGGIYNQKLNKNFRPEEMASHSFFINHPEEFFDFYRKRFVYLDAKPNAGHLALAELERRGNLSAIVTQNIDGLHQVAGSKTVYELHGSIRRGVCVACGEVYDVNFIMKNVKFMNYILVQFIGAIGYTLLALSYFKKEKKQILVYKKYGRRLSIIVSSNE